jgi:hypothetical protein
VENLDIFGLCIGRCVYNTTRRSHIIRGYRGWGGGRCTGPGGDTYVLVVVFRVICCNVLTFEEQETGFFFRHMYAKPT